MAKSRCRFKIYIKNMINHRWINEFIEFNIQYILLFVLWRESLLQPTTNQKYNIDYDFDLLLIYNFFQKKIRIMIIWRKWKKKQTTWNNTLKIDMQFWYPNTKTLRMIYFLHNLMYDCWSERKKWDILLILAIGALD